MCQALLCLTQQDAWENRLGGFRGAKASSTFNLTCHAHFSIYLTRMLYFSVCAYVQILLERFPLPELQEQVLQRCVQCLEVNAIRCAQPYLHR